MTTESDFTETQVTALRLLAVNAWRGDDLAHHLGIDRAMLDNRLSRLNASGYVDFGDNGDYSITPTGSALIASIDAEIGNLTARVRGGERE